MKLMTVAESAVQDKTACMRRLSLLYTHTNNKLVKVIYHTTSILAKSINKIPDIKVIF